MTIGQKHLKGKHILLHSFRGLNFILAGRRGKAAPSLVEGTWDRNYSDQGGLGKQEIRLHMGWGGMGWGGATIFTHPSYFCLRQRFYNLPKWHHPAGNSLQNMSLQRALQIQTRVEIPKVLCVKDSKYISSKFMRKIEKTSVSWEQWRTYPRWQLEEPACSVKDHDKLSNPS